MPKSREEMKAKLMKQAEAVIDELLEWHLETGKPNLTQVEGKVLDLRQQLSKQMSQTVIENQATVRPVPGPSCANCGEEMSYKGLKENSASSWVGELKIERGYYYCERCRSGLFPPEQTT